MYLAPATVLVSAPFFAIASIMYGGRMQRIEPPRTMSIVSGGSGERRTASSGTASMFGLQPRARQRIAACGRTPTSFLGKRLHCDSQSHHLQYGQQTFQLGIAAVRKRTV